MLDGLLQPKTDQLAVFAAASQLLGAPGSARSKRRDKLRDDQTLKPVLFGQQLGKAQRAALAAHTERLRNEWPVFLPKRFDVELPSSLAGQNNRPPHDAFQSFGILDEVEHQFRQKSVQTLAEDARGVSLYFASEIGSNGWPDPGVIYPTRWVCGLVQSSADFATQFEMVNRLVHDTGIARCFTEITDHRSSKTIGTNVFHVRPRSDELQYLGDITRPSRFGTAITSFRLRLAPAADKSGTSLFVWAQTVDAMNGM